jgi:hypothetical protein
VLVVGGLLGHPEGPADVLPGPASASCPLDLNYLGLFNKASQLGDRSQPRFRVGSPREIHQPGLPCLFVHHASNLVDAMLLVNIC